MLTKGLGTFGELLIRSHREATAGLVDVATPARFDHPRCNVLRKTHHPCGVPDFRSPSLRFRILLVRISNLTDDFGPLRNRREFSAFERQPLGCLSELTMDSLPLGEILLFALQHEVDQGLVADFDDGCAIRKLAILEVLRRNLDLLSHLIQRLG
jgi:hypothetical protein